jgi:hypothetical protein
MGWVIGIVVLLVVAAVVRRLVRGRRAPRFDQEQLENANYSQIGQDVRNFDQRYGNMG